MSAPLTVQQATRRYVGLTALRWLPVGLTIPVSVLLAVSRGLTLAEVGLVFFVHSVLIVVLELPTGGLADVLGRRAVLVASGLLHLSACLAYATADGVPGFLLAACLQAVGRALDSGPLQAWYVDAVRTADPGADVVPGLSKAGVADCVGLAAGSVLGGLAPALLAGSGPSALVLPYVAAAGLDLVSIGAVLALVTRTGPTAPGSAVQAVRSGLAEVPRTVAATLRLSARDGVLRRVLLLSLVCGFSLSTLELVGPPLFADLAGSATGGSATFGVVMAVSFLAGAVGAALAPRCRRLAGGSTAWAVGVLTALSGLAVAGVAATATVALAATAYAGFYLANAASWPLADAVLHDRVGSAQRATALSASSLCLQLGGAVSSLVAPVVRTTLGGSAAVYLLTGAVAVLASLLAVGLPGSRAVVPEDRPQLV